MSALRPVFRYLSPSGPHARLSILVFHRVLPVPDPLFPDLPDAVRFRRLLGWLRGWLNILPLDLAVEFLVAGRLPERAAAITFDDGYADNASVALPLLQEQGLSATFFIATGFLDGGRMWNDTVIEAIRHSRLATLDLEPLGLRQYALTTPHDRRVAIDQCVAGLKYLPSEQRTAASEEVAAIAAVRPPCDLMLSSREVQKLHRAGMGIGAHTISHPILARLTLDEARREIQGSKTQLEHLVEEAVQMFAYPNGKLGDDYEHDHVELVRDVGFVAAFSTNHGAAGAGSDLMQLPRFTPWDRDPLRFGARLLANLRQSPQRAA